MHYSHCRSCCFCATVKYCSASEMPWQMKLVLQMYENIVIDPNKCHIIMLFIVYSMKIKLVIQKLSFPLIMNHITIIMSVKIILHTF